MCSTLVEILHPHNVLVFDSVWQQHTWIMFSAQISQQGDSYSTVTTERIWHEAESPSQHSNLILQIEVPLLFLLHTLHGKHLSGLLLLHHVNLRERPSVNEDKHTFIVTYLPYLHLSLRQSQMTFKSFSQFCVTWNQCKKTIFPLCGWTNHVLYNASLQRWKAVTKEKVKLMFEGFLVKVFNYYKLNIFLN